MHVAVFKVSDGVGCETNTHLCFSYGLTGTCTICLFMACVSAGLCGALLMAWLVRSASVTAPCPVVSSALVSMPVKHGSGQQHVCRRHLSKGRLGSCCLVTASMPACTHVRCSGTLVSDLPALWAAGNVSRSRSLNMQGDSAHCCHKTPSSVSKEGTYLKTQPSTDTLE